MVAFVHEEFFDTVVMLLIVNGSSRSLKLKNFFFAPAPAFWSMRGSTAVQQGSGSAICHSGYNFKGKKSVVCGQLSDSC